MDVAFCTAKQAHRPLLEGCPPVFSRMEAPFPYPRRIHAPYRSPNRSPWSCHAPCSATPSSGSSGLPCPFGHTPEWAPSSRRANPSPRADGQRLAGPWHPRSEPHHDSPLILCGQSNTSLCPNMVQARLPQSTGRFEGAHAPGPHEGQGRPDPGRENDGRRCKPPDTHMRRLGCRGRCSAPFLAGTPVGPMVPYSARFDTAPFLPYGFYVYACTSTAHIDAPEPPDHAECGRLAQGWHKTASCRAGRSSGCCAFAVRPVFRHGAPPERMEHFRTNLHRLRGVPHGVHACAWGCVQDNNRRPVIEDRSREGRK